MSSTEVTDRLTRSGRGAQTWVGMAIGVLLLLSALVLWQQPATAPSSAGSIPLGGSGSGSRSAGAVGDDPALVPKRLQAEGGLVDASVLPVQVSSGELKVPEDARTVGWWRDGAAPGDERGTVVLAGHVDTVQGPGALYRLETLEPGQRLAVESATGSRNYRVEARQAYRKDRLPDDIFTVEGAPRLAVITCGGAFDESTRTYEYNVVVYAVPA